MKECGLLTARSTLPSGNEKAKINVPGGRLGSMAQGLCLEERFTRKTGTEVQSRDAGWLAGWRT